MFAARISNRFSSRYLWIRPKSWIFLTRSILLITYTLILSFFYSGITFWVSQFYIKISPKLALISEYTKCTWTTFECDILSYEIGGITNCEITRYGDPNILIFYAGIIFWASQFYIKISPKLALISEYTKCTLTTFECDTP